MTYEKAELGRQAKLYQFDRDQFEKVDRLIHILQYLNSSPVLSSLVALKGGTAINLTVFEVPRLSTDIDLDFTENLPKEKMLRIREQIHRYLLKYMISQGYTLNVLKSKDTYALDSLVFSYTNAGGMNDNIKIEINYMARCHILQTEQRSTLIPWADSSFSVNCLNLTELYGSKITALINRGAARDLFDISNMIESRIFSADQYSLLRKCALIYLTIGSKESEELFSYGKIEGISQHKIFTDLVPMLKHGTFFDTEKAKELCIQFLKELFVLNRGEQEYINAFVDYKEFHPEYLFDDKDLSARISQHPMALWKCRPAERKASVREQLETFKEEQNLDLGQFNRNSMER